MDNYPEVKSPFEKFMENLGKAQTWMGEQALEQAITPRHLQAYRTLREFNDPRGIYMRMPMVPEVN